MPGKVKVKIVAGRNLPVMDRSNDTTDAYVEVKLGTTTFKTDVCRKSLNPQWNSEWFRFEMDDLELQDEPLQIRLMDHDTYSANDAIGKVYLDLNPLLLTSSKDSSGKLISGWIPVYDTMHGIRGEVSLVVKVELFSDLNKFRQSSCGVMFFFTQAIPDGYFAHAIHGFVEELVVNDDPEYQWIDKIRTPRASNEARQTLFSKLSGEVQRRVGLKALELGGNAVIGYRQCFDLEGESGIVVRGIGTAATLTKHYESQLSPSGQEYGGAQREFQSLDDDGLLLPFSSHPPMLSKTSRSKRTGSRVPLSTHSMPNTLIPHLHCLRSSSIIPNRAPFSASIITASTLSQARYTSNVLRPLPAPSSSNFSSGAFKTLLQAVSGRCENHYRSQSDTSVIVHTTASEPARISSEFRLLSRPLSLVEGTEPIHQQRMDCRVKSIEVGTTTDEKVSFRTGTESPSSLSGNDTECKVEDADVEDDEDEDRKGAKETNFYLFPHRKPRGSKKKDRYSKSSLLKRASMNFADSKRLGSSSKGKEKLTDEIVKFFRKKKLLTGDKDDSSSLSESASPYRQVKSSLLRRRHKCQRSLHRCNSESFSLGETSMDSLPSIQSDMVFDNRDDTDSNSLESLPQQQPPTHSSPGNSPNNPTDPGSDREEVSVDKSRSVQCGAPAESMGSNSSGALSGTKLADPVSTARVIEAVKDLGYGMEKPMRLYISSADALLVIDPVMSGIGIDTERMTNNNTANGNQAPSCKEAIQYTDSGGGSSTSGPDKFPDAGCRMPRNKTSYHDCLKVRDHKGGYKGALGEGREAVSGEKSQRIPSLDSSCSNTSNTRSTSSLTYNSSSSSSGFGGRRPPLTAPSTAFMSSSPAVRVFPPEVVTSTIERPSQGDSCDKPGVSDDLRDRSLMESRRSDVVNESLAVSVPPRICNYVLDERILLRAREPVPSPFPESHVPDRSNVGGSVDGEWTSKDENDEIRLAQPSRARDPPLGGVGLETLLARSSCSSVTTSTTITPVVTSTFCANAVNTTTTTTITSTATTVTYANVHVILSSQTNASSTNMPPAPLPMVSKSTSITNGSSTLTTSRPQGPPPAVGAHMPSSSSGGVSQSKQQVGQQKVVSTVSFINRRSSESDLSAPPKPISSNATTVTTVVASSSHGKTLTFAPMPPRRLITADHFEMLEYPFITLNQLPPGFIQHLGGTVSARSVKLLERISNLDEPESRDSWWTEIRMEIRSHARSIGCNVVLGYEEQTTMCDDVCVLSASGTAAVLSGSLGETCDITIPNVMKVPGSDGCACTRAEKEKSQSNRTDSISSQHNNCIKCSTKLRHGSSESSDSNCSLCHIPYNESSVPFPVKMTRCLLCKKGKVPDILLATIDLPVGLQCYGKSCLIQAQVYRPKKDCKGEISAKEVSDSLPFLEYELHRRLINKLKVRGMNAIFALQVQICLGEKLMVGLATGTAVFVSCLPPPCVPKISAGNMKTDSQKVIQFQKVVQEAYERNREVYDLKNTVPLNVTNGNPSVSSDGEESDEDLPDIDLATGNKDTYVLEVDDAEDIDIIQVLIDQSPELGFYMNNINFLHGFENYRVTSQQMFTQVWRCRISSLITLRQFTSYFDKLLQAVAFKLRRISPCVLSKLRYRVELPEQDEIQLSIIGLAVKIEENKSTVTPTAEGFQGTTAEAPEVITTEPELLSSPSQKSAPISIATIGAAPHPGVNTSASSDLLLNVSSGGPGSAPVATTSPGSPGAVLNQIYSLSAPKSKAYPKAVTLFSRPKCIEITPLSHIPGGKIEKYLGNLNFFFIRETTSIREVSEFTQINGGLSGFVHSFIAEVLAIVRAHVAALGGNAMVSYFMTELALLHNPHKNQGQCLVNVGGDVVYAVYPNTL